MKLILLKQIALVLLSAFIVASCDSSSESGSDSDPDKEGRAPASVTGKTFILKSYGKNIGSGPKGDFSGDTEYRLAFSSTGNNYTLTGNNRTSDGTYEYTRKIINTTLELDLTETSDPKVYGTTAITTGKFTFYFGFVGGPTYGYEAKFGDNEMGGTFSEK